MRDETGTRNQKDRASLVPAAPPLALPDRLETIFIDLDGVLADFHSEIVRLWGQDPEAFEDEDWAPVGEWGLSVPVGDFWSRIQAQGAGWWERLPKLPWTDALWRSCGEAADRVVVLTSPGPFSESVAGKYDWVRRQLGTTKMLIGSPKDACSRPGHLLIDDREGYRRRWERAGGSMVCLRRPWSPLGVRPEVLIEALKIKNITRTR